jgi:hypothetical protein
MRGLTWPTKRGHVVHAHVLGKNKSRPFLSKINAETSLG